MEEIFLLSEKELTKEKLEEYFEKYVLAAVVTKEEDQRLDRSKMPGEFQETRNPWLRYKEAQIKVYKVDWEKTELLKKEPVCFENTEELKLPKGSNVTNQMLLRISSLIRENISEQIRRY